MSPLPRVQELGFDKEVRVGDIAMFNDRVVIAVKVAPSRDEGVVRIGWSATWEFLDSPKWRLIFWWRGVKARAAFYWPQCAAWFTDYEYGGYRARSRCFHGRWHRGAHRTLGGSEWR